MRILFFILMLSSGILQAQVQDSALLDANKKHIIILTAFDNHITKHPDVTYVDDRAGKERELFQLLADSLKQVLAARIKNEYHQEASVIDNMMAVTESIDTAIRALMKIKNATSAIVIREFTVYFVQKDVTVEKNSEGSKTRTALYDICSYARYSFYYGKDGVRNSQIGKCEYYTDRQVVSGLFAMGPNILKKKKDAFKQIPKNAGFYLTEINNVLRIADNGFYNESTAQPKGLEIGALQGSYKRNIEPKKVEPVDTLLKYSLSFAGQSQIMYDGTSLKTRIFNQPLCQAGDVSYYKGKYDNSHSWYLLAYMGLPGEISFMEGFFNFVNTSPDEHKNKYDKVYARIISSTGMLYHTRGKFAQADQLLTRATQKCMDYFGRNSKEYLISLHNLAVLRKDMGFYDEADSIFNYLQPVFKDLYSANSFQYIAILNNRAMLLAELGRTKEAIQLLDEALETGSTVLSSAYFDYERILTNRALLKQESGEIDGAEKDYLRAIDNMEKKGFDDHPDYTNILMYYSSLRLQKNDPDALSFLSKVTDRIRKLYKKDQPAKVKEITNADDDYMYELFSQKPNDIYRPLTAKALGNMGDYYLNKNSYLEARDIYREVISIQSSVLGEKHKDYLNTLMKLGVCEWQLQDNDNATLHFSKAINGYQSIVSKLFRSMNEPEKTAFWKTLKPAIDTYLAYVLEAGQSDPSLLKEAYELQLKTKGLLVNSTKQTRNIILNSGDSVLNKLYNEWVYLKTKLSTYYSSPLEDLKEDKIDLSELENRANDTEKELSRRSSRFAMEYSPLTISFEDVKAKLNKDEMAIEIIRVFHFYGSRKGESEYISLVIRKDSSHPILVRMGNGRDIEQNYLSQYKKSVKNKTADTKSYAIFWQPLESIIGNCKTIYVSVDGVYNSINLNTLQRHDGTFLLDNYNIILVNNTRSIRSGLKSTVRLAGQETEALLLGSPNYGNDEVIPPLPETKEEIQQIDTLLLRDHVKSKTLIEENATEQNIKSIHQPAILHVATHGFFNENVDLSKKMNMGVHVSFAKDNVLLRSGLFFNGAASIFNKDPILDASNNGILYAYEAMNLNLQGAHLVVLSACETGIGEIMNGEGVFGLSRSFQVAGADKILMSLWKVDDRVTKELMITFYKNWLRSNDPQQAFISAQKAIKLKYPEPYYWGAFVLLN